MLRIVAALLFGLAPWTPALGDELILSKIDSGGSERAEVVYRLSTAATGTGVLHVEWKDSLGRVVERFAVPFRLSGSADVAFALDLRRAVGISNKLRARVAFDGTAQGEPIHRDRDAQLSFLLPPRANPWRDFQAIMWQPQTAQQYAAMRDLGVTAGVVTLHRRSIPDRSAKAQMTALASNNLRWYIENIATDFYAAYHRWTLGQPVNWRFQRTKRIFAEDPANPETFVRVPSLSDATWLRKIRERLVRTVRAQDRYAPLFYNLADEPGIADLSIFWDFDFSQASLAGFRLWLKQRYRTLSALNQQWDSRFAHWDSVRPMTTAEAMAQADENYSAWADFKEWMDEAFARALRVGSDAVHATAPRALAAIEGAQVPGWGGYDYSRLVRAVDAIELHDEGGNLDIVRSLDPNLVLLTTVTIGAPNTVYTIWRELLRGTRGVVLWDPRGSFVHPDGTPGSGAAEASPALRAIGAGLGALLINSERHADPIAILYSPASIRTQWLLDWRSRGDAWATRDIDSSYEDASPVRSSMVGYARILESRGWHPRFLSSALVGSGELKRGKYRFLFLPHSIALSGMEISAIRAFMEGGGVVVADSEPGSFDDHARRLARPALNGMFADTGREPTEAPNGRDRATGFLVSGVENCENEATSAKCVGIGGQLAQLLEDHGLKPPIAPRSPVGEAVTDVSSYLFEDGSVDIVAIQRDGDMQGGNTRGGVVGSDEEILMPLPQRSQVCDLRELKLLEPTDRINVNLRAAEPRILAISPTAFRHLSIQAPKRVRAGHGAELAIARAGKAFPNDIVHVVVFRPSGRAARDYGRNVRLSRGRGIVHIPFAQSDEPGTWTVELSDFLGCATTRIELKVG